MRERFRQRFCFVIVIIDYFARKRRSKRRVKKRRRRDPPFLLLHLLPGIKKRKNHQLDPHLSHHLALARRATRPTTSYVLSSSIFTNSSTRGGATKSQNQIVLRLPRSIQRERKERERRLHPRGKSRENERFRETSAVDWFFLLFFSLRRTSSSRERRREEEEISISFFSNERAFLFYALPPCLLSPLLRELEQSAHRGRRRRRHLSFLSLLASRSLKIYIESARDHRRLMMRRRDFSLSTKSLVVKEKKRKKWKGPEKKNASPQTKNNRFITPLLLRVFPYLASARHASEIHSSLLLIRVCILETKKKRQRRRLERRSVLKSEERERTRFFFRLRKASLALLFHFFHFFFRRRFCFFFFGAKKRSSLCT